MSLLCLRSLLRISFIKPLSLVDIPLLFSRKYFHSRKFNTGLLYVSVWERENSYVRDRMRNLILEWALLYSSGCPNHLTLLPSFGRTLLCLGLDQRSSLSSHSFCVLPHFCFCPTYLRSPRRPPGIDTALTSSRKPPVTPVLCLFSLPTTPRQREKSG